MVKILHTADLHLGSTFSILDSEKANIRKKELVDMFDEIIEKVKQENIEYLLIAGDLFDNSGCIKTAEYVSAKFGEIPDVNVFIAAGNHDAKTKIYDKLKWSENVHIFGSEMECAEFEECVIYGASFMNNYQKLPLLSGDIQTSNKINILVMHGDFKDDAYNLIDKENLRRFDYAALGHIHKYTGIERIGNSYFAYSGVPASRGFDECGETGYIIGTVGKGTENLKYCRTYARQYNIIKYHPEAEDDNVSIVEKLKVNMKKDDLYLINLVGECESVLSEEYIEKALENECFYVKINNCTDYKLDYSEMADDYSLMGIFVRDMIGKIEREENPEIRKEYEAALKEGIEVLRGQGDLFD